MTAYKKIAPSGVEYWKDKDGRFHREDGPAIIYSNGAWDWYIHGKNITEQVQHWMKSLDVFWPWDQEIQIQFLLAFT